MATLRTDAFTAANGTALTTYNSQWSYVQGVYGINTNAAHSASSGTETAARDNANTYPNDQWSQGTAVAVANGGWIGVSVRCSNSIVSYYEYYSDSANDATLALMAGGTWTSLASGSPVAANDVMYIEAQGTAILAKKNAANQFGGAVTNASIASGWAGIAGYSNLTGSRVDDWSGGDFGGGGGGIVIPVMMNQYRQRSN